MNIDKIETNIKRNMYLHKSINIKMHSNNEKIENERINIYPEIKFQEIIGFGAALTQSAGYLLSNVNKNVANEIINEYFSKEGLNYSILRLPIGSSDFSTHSYSYSNKKDLSDFNIDEDEKYIIPIIEKAKSNSSNIQFLATPWSPPSFMKNNKMLRFGGKLQDRYKDLYAEYLTKYILEYQKRNIDINYITVQNEPNAVQIWESCIYSASEEADFIKNYLYPKLKANNLNTKIFIWDHNKDNMLYRVFNTISDSEINEYIYGIAFHWYTGSHFENIKLVHDLFPSKLMFHTEGCTGYSHFNPKDELFNGELYANEIIGDFNNGTNAFIDWNILLDYNGGPNHKNNYCNSPIMLNEDKTDYIKTPSFYYIAQFGKYIKPGAKRIAFSRYTENIQVTAFQNPDKSVIIILLNKNDYNIEYNLCYKNYYFHDNMDSHAIVTFVINGDEKND
ncbi:MAG: glycoside hydrolase family 30 protein [Clostridia bacterium]|nr:glycoside hydrolase family 30 protein [Clostridia bacterium]